ncbi:hypothetical protein EBB07_03795 [Paenibacillaceae bacterium]|nr:hypothetical protein EBB07_03795 [Paenibacillaceae bacterium]
MIPLTSELENREHKFLEVQRLLDPYEFSLGGNWDYEQGTFDRYLDKEHMVWLRIPFQVTAGNIDSETSDNNAMIRIGRPFILKHIYNDGIDREAQPRLLGGLIDQFQEPIDKDAEVETKWVDKGQMLLHDVETTFTRH